MPPLERDSSLSFFIMQNHLRQRRDEMKKPVQIFRTNMRTYSHAGFGNREIASFFIGRPDGPTSNLYAVSEREAHELVTNLPDELLELIKTHYGLYESVIEPDKEVAAQILVKVEEELQDGTLGAKQFEAIKEEVLTPSDEDEVDIYDMNITQLRQVASQLEIKGYTKYSKDELLKKIEEVAEASES